MWMPQILYSLSSGTRYLCSRKLIKITYITQDGCLNLELTPTEVPIPSVTVVWLSGKISYGHHYRSASSLLSRHRST